MGKNMGLGKNKLGKNAKAETILRRVLLLAFAGVFVVLFVQVLFNNMHFARNPLWVILASVLWLGLFWLLWRVTLGLKRDFWEKREKWALAGFAILAAVTLTLVYSQLAAYPTMDFERVFTGAVNFAVAGFIEEPYLDYFYKYPNNLPLTIVLQFAFRAARKVGISNFYAVGAVLNACSYFVCYGFVYACCRRLLGVKAGFFAIFLMYFCLPLQSYISIFYTDAMTLWCPPAAFYCYLRLRDANTWKGKSLAALLLGICVAMGAVLKYSAVLVLIAICVDMLLRADWARLGMAVASFALVFVLLTTALNAYKFANFLDENLAADRATPFTSWIMMGLKGDGAHNADDNYFIWYWETAEEKEYYARHELLARLQAFTPAEFIAFMNQKALRSFGSGNLDAPVTVGSSPMKQNVYVELVSKGGRYFEGYDTFTQGYHVALFGLIIAGAIIAARKKDWRMFVPFLSIFGLFLFLLLWESGQRYLLHYFGVFILAAAFGASALGTRLDEKPKKAELAPVNEEKVN